MNFSVKPRDGFAIDDLRAAVSRLRENPGSTLTIEPGVYTLCDALAKKTQENVMNGVYGGNPEPTLFCPEFPYTVGLDFAGVSDAEVIADGVTFLADGYMETVSLHYCRNVSIRGLNIDLKRRSFSSGTIVGFYSSRNRGECYVDVDFTDKTMLSDKTPMPRLIIFDTFKKRIAAVTGCERSEWFADRKIMRLWGVPVADCAGFRLTAVHCFHFRPQILIHEAADTTLTDVTIKNSCGMGIVGHRARNVTLRGLRVLPDDPAMFGGRGGMSTSTDATHFTSCSGKLAFYGCLFEGNGDDCTNVHTYYQTVSEASGSACTASILAPTGTHCQKPDVPSPGDILELVDGGNLSYIDRFTVVESGELDGAYRSRLTLDKPLPDGADGCLFLNASRMPSLEFIDCRCKNHLARSVLVKTRNVRIENCVFDGSTGTAVHIGAEGWWHEGGASENVTVSGCRMVHTGEQGVGRIDGAGAVAVSVDAADATAAIHRNITIRDCCFKTNTECDLSLKCADGVVIENNSGARIEIRHSCKNIRIK